MNHDLQSTRERHPASGGGCVVDTTEPKRGVRCESRPCGRCGCTATWTQSGKFSDFDPPADLACQCDCHHAWHFIHRGEPEVSNALAS